MFAHGEKKISTAHPITMGLHGTRALEEAALGCRGNAVCLMSMDCGEEHEMQDMVAICPRPRVLFFT